MKRTVKRHKHARINADDPIHFSFDGKRYRGYEGDTLASALLANGVAVVGRSFKIHRPRGVFAAGKEEVNAFVQLEEGPYTEPNARATLVPLYADLKATGQNAWPSVRFDGLAMLGLFKRVLPASFYYKTFKWPSWHTWEGLVRRIAGLGKAPSQPDPQTYQKQTVHTDILIVGAGRAGLMAALEIVREGHQRVLVLDEQEKFGGSLLASAEQADRAWLKRVLADLAGRDNVTLMSRTTVNGYYDHNVLAALERVGNHLGTQAEQSQPRERFWRIHAGQVILATGAHERPLVFPNNDRPGIMLASAIREYTHRYGLTLGDNVVFYANNDSAWDVALELVTAGIKVTAIVDVRSTVVAKLQRRATLAGIELKLGYAVVDTRGRSGIKKLLLRKLTADRDHLTGPKESLSCDLLAISGGWTPAIHLYSQSGGKLIFRDADTCFVPDVASQAVTVVGRANGEFSQPLNLQALWSTPDVSSEYQWIDFQYDVTVSDIQLAVRENFISVEHVKRYTTNGMSIDQGKTSNVNGLAILAQETERQIPEVGTTRFRPPYHPTTIGAYAGRELGPLYTPGFQLPAHVCHVALDAQFEDYGGWQRPEYYPRPGEDEHQAIAREVLAVRNSVGLLDYSPLGKLEVHGPDAREFLNRMYANNMVTLKVGGARYGLMLNEKGIVIDDGVLVCLAEDHFLMHTTSGGAGTIHQVLEEWLQCEWMQLEVLVTNVTTQWATLTLSGPNARQVLEKLDGDIDLAHDSFSHMQYREGTLCGVPARLLRASFTGEVSFEVSVPARHGQALWEELMTAGKNYGITPFGLESLMVMRTEKGYLHVGADTDGNTMPQDLGWAGVIAKKPADFVGRRSLSIEVGQDEQRLQLTGIELLDSSADILAGAHVLSANGDSSTGYVTSAYHSPTLGRTVALGIVAGAHARQDEEVTLFYNGNRQAARLVKPGGYDPEGERLNG